MLDTLSKGFRNARNFLNGQAVLTESNINTALSEVRDSLLEADVNIDVIEQFLAAVKEKSLGKEVTTAFQKRKVSPAQHFIKICQDELVNLMGPESTSVELSKPIGSIMMVGLQGAGKTTTTAKLAAYFKKKSRKPLLVAADIYRPAAVRQLEILGAEMSVPVYADAALAPPQLCANAFARARELGCDLVIFDTAGRLAIDDTLMRELESIKNLAKPDQILLVVDAMIGQDSVTTAFEFNRRLEIDGFILTKLDGDARGGAALSIKAITKKPIKFLGTGEKAANLEEFRPEGLASRILGMGDIASLVQDFEEHVDKVQAEKDAERMLKGQFSLQDFLNQIRMLRKMGPLAGLMEKLPGMGQMGAQIKAADGEGQMRKIESMILSMTPRERKQPEVIAKFKSRRKRIALGSGRTEVEVDALLKQFQMMKDMMGNLGKMPGLNPAMGMRSMAPSPGFSMPKPSPDRKDKRRREKLARKKNKKR
ncbi:MAG: signal recognition particle protein [Myxococcota bacterium]